MHSEPATVSANIHAGIGCDFGAVVVGAAVDDAALSVDVAAPSSES
jgi:hypothetical protein